MISNNRNLFTVSKFRNIVTNYIRTKILIFSCRAEFSYFCSEKWIVYTRRCINGVAVFCCRCRRAQDLLSVISFITIRYDDDVTSSVILLCASTAGSSPQLQPGSIVPAEWKYDALSTVVPPNECGWSYTKIQLNDGSHWNVSDRPTCFTPVLSVDHLQKLWVFCYFNYFD